MQNEHSKPKHNRLIGLLSGWLSSQITRAQLAIFGLIGVLLILSGYAIWSSLSTSRLGAQAISSSILSDHYASAAEAVAAEESLERKYRLEPSVKVRRRYDAASQALKHELELVSRDGTAEDREIVERVLIAHDPYLESINRMFAAIDRADFATALEIDTDEVDPKFEIIAKSVESAADEHRTVSLRALQQLRSREEFNAKATTASFLIGLALIAMFYRILRHAQLQLDLQRSKALYESLHDALTGLPNRTLLNDRFEQVLRSARRDGLSTGLLLLDLDRFKEVNDTLGHQYGDYLLNQIGIRLLSKLRAVDTIARLGGDEFAVLLPDVKGITGAIEVAQRLRLSLTETFEVENVLIEIEANIGVVISGVHGDDVVTLMKNADIAMYAAKHLGQGVLVYDQEIDKHSFERLPLLGELRRGIEQGELLLNYQPKVNLTTDKISGAEALVRWQHPERGLIFPDEFIPFAELTGLIGSLTRRVLDLALSQVRHWLDAGHRIPVSVNISARNLLDDQLVSFISELLARYQLPAQMLELEVTESAIMLDPQRAHKMLRLLHDIGIRISIDDFGAGYTSLAQLKTLPVDELKIDKSFVMTMLSEPSNTLIVKSVIELGHNFGMSVVAEGVETAEALAALKSYRCDIAQGYHLCKPKNAKIFLDWYCNRGNIALHNANVQMQPRGSTQ
jgi:diguanylate cyclase (GGDEF)-like protein